MKSQWNFLSWLRKKKKIGGGKSEKSESGKGNKSGPGAAPFSLRREKGELKAVRTDNNPSDPFWGKESRTAGGLTPESEKSTLWSFPG